ncbi:hypothetical protein METBISCDRAFT_23308 [Metschnikowia bicuspidata]|uniref:Glycoside hydrolase n=1 Tax=Metschnikowia bicuspidata TaxID=27322 RepID=A0A4P9ZC02_9ASCO|nr:hypothetical protein METBISCDRAFT_23308 [Metschnikowia bicuspidata]
MEFIKEQRIQRIRKDDTDSFTDPTVFNICKKLGIQIDQAIRIGSLGDFELDLVIEWAKKNGWDIFSSFNFDYDTFEEFSVELVLPIISHIGEAKTKLANAGYNGPISSVSSPDTYFIFPDLCRLAPIDFVGINAQLYFTQRPPRDAGTFILEEKRRVERICDKPVKIFETGYPSAGEKFGDSVPSEENQMLVLNLILQATDGDVTLRSLYDEVWLSPGPHRIEQHFGIFKPTY